MIIKSSLCAALFALTAQACMAQTATPDILSSSGGYATNATASLSWTMGESLIETGSSSNNFLTQGFQQPSGIVLTAPDNASTKNGSTSVNTGLGTGGTQYGNISAYPNPVINTVYITGTSQPCKVDVLDLTGRMLFTKELSGSDDNQVNMAEYAAGIYLFRVYNTDGQLLQTLKIDKIK